MGDDAAEALLDAHPGLFEYAPTLTQANNQCIVTEEIADAQRLLQERWDGPVLFKDVASATRLVAYNRVPELFDRVVFRNCRCLVMVGCGSLPFTIFHVHDRTEVPEIIGIDIVPEAVETANELAKRLGYARVRAELQDGRSYDYSQAQIVFIANMVSPKPTVVSRIADTAPKDVQIIVREPYSLGRLWAESSERSPDPRLEITGRGRSGSWNLSRAVFLSRRSVPTSKVRSG